MRCTKYGAEIPDQRLLCLACGRKSYIPKPHRLKSAKTGKPLHHTWFAGYEIDARAVGFKKEDDFAHPLSSLIRNVYQRPSKWAGACDKGATFGRPRAQGILLGHLIYLISKLFVN